MACLIRVWGRVAGRDKGNGAVDVGRYTPVVRRGGLSGALAKRTIVARAPVDEA